MFFSKPSNDIKYNKIKEIEEELYDYVALDYGLDDEPKNHPRRKIVNLKVWVLANSIYDISVAGLEDEYYDEDDCSEFPIHWSYVIEFINKTYSRGAMFDNPYAQHHISYYWVHYDRLNS